MLPGADTSRYGLEHGTHGIVHLLHIGMGSSQLISGDTLHAPVARGVASHGALEGMAIEAQSSVRAARRNLGVSSLDRYVLGHLNAMGIRKQEVGLRTETLLGGVYRPMPLPGGAPPSVREEPTHGIQVHAHLDSGNSEARITPQLPPIVVTQGVSIGGGQASPGRATASLDMLDKQLPAGVLLPPPGMALGLQHAVFRDAVEARFAVNELQEADASDSSAAVAAVGGTGAFNVSVRLSSTRIADGELVELWPSLGDAVDISELLTVQDVQIAGMPCVSAAVVGKSAGGESAEPVVHVQCVGLLPAASARVLEEDAGTVTVRLIARRTIHGVAARGAARVAKGLAVYAHEGEIIAAVGATPGGLLVARLGSSGV